MTWGVTAVAGATLIGGYLQSEAVSDASQAQGQASEAAIAEQRRQFDISQEQYNAMTEEERRRFDISQDQYNAMTEEERRRFGIARSDYERQVATEEQRYQQGRADYAPWRESGQAATSRLSQLLGIGGDSSAAGYGDLNKKFSIADFMEDPVIKLGYQSGLEQGTQAIDRMAGARGSRNSGATLKALTRFGTDYSGQKAGESSKRFYGDQNRTFGRLASVAGYGQAPSGQGAQPGRPGSQGAQPGSPGSGGQISPPGYPDIAGSLMSQGNARGASAIAQGNIWGGALQNIGNWYGQNQMLNRMYPQQSSPSYYYDDFDYGDSFEGVGGGSGGYGYAPD